MRSCDAQKSWTGFKLHWFSNHEVAYLILALASVYLRWRLEVDVEIIHCISAEKLFSFHFHFIFFCVFRPSATVSRIGLMESCTWHCGGPTPPHHHHPTTNTTTPSPPLPGMRTWWMVGTRPFRCLSALAAEMNLVAVDCPCPFHLGSP